MGGEAREPLHIRARTPPEHMHMNLSTFAPESHLNTSRNVDHSHAMHVNLSTFEPTCQSPRQMCQSPGLLGLHVALQDGTERSHLCITRRGQEGRSRRAIPYMYVAQG